MARHDFASPPEAVFALFTNGEQLARWFCDACESDAAPGGVVHAAWKDEDGAAWDRVGHWQVFEPPVRASLVWDDPPHPAENLEAEQGRHVGSEEPGQAPHAPEHRDVLHIAIAPIEGGSSVTVLCSLPPPHPTIRDEALVEVVEAGWQKTFQVLEALLP
jgi:uncharacterized protein YndB with AHSA1/START domain